jgi:hypothetical protein
MTLAVALAIQETGRGGCRVVERVNGICAAATLTVVAQRVV